jgi:hypothetical protein
MNVRFSDNAVRCRLTLADLERLLTGRAVALELGLPRDHTFRFNVRPSALEGWGLEADPTGLWLTISRSELERLSQSAPSKRGIEQAFDTANGGRLAVSVEVDVKDRPPAPAADFSTAC